MKICHQSQNRKEEPDVNAFLKGFEGLDEFKICCGEQKRCSTKANDAKKRKSNKFDLIFFYKSIN